MDEINSDFASTDVVLVIGANDVVNPSAKDDELANFWHANLGSEQSSNRIVIKRSMNTGYAGLDNPLFYLDKTMMIFGDAKKMVEENGAYH